MFGEVLTMSLIPVMKFLFLSPLSAKPQNAQQATKCLIVFDHFVGLALKGLSSNNFFLNKYWEMCCTSVEYLVIGHY